MATNVITVTHTADSGSGSLRAAIAAASPDTTIQFAASLANQTITLTSGQLEIAVGKHLVIDGAATANLTLSGDNRSRLFFLNSTAANPTRLTVKNLTLANGYTRDRGGAISTTHQGELTVENVVFTNNVADKGGGAIFSEFEGTLTVTGSRFQGNRATAGNDERGAGAIAFWGPRAFIVRNSEFVNNQGINGGAINSLNGKLTIENSRFINNSTLAARFDNGQPKPDLRGYGGAIYTDRASAISEPSGTIRISRSIFEGNQGRGEGGAAYLYTGTQDNVVIEASSFTGNQVTELANGNRGNGGALVVLSNGHNRGLTIAQSTFANNTATNQGGGVWLMDAPATITNSTFSGNRIGGTTSAPEFDRVGGAMALYSPTTIVNTTIANNHAHWVGGGISADAADRVTVKNTIFDNNTADNGANGWGIQQHTSRELIDEGGNLQWPPKRTNNWNDYNVTPSIRLLNPQLSPLQDNGGGLLTHIPLAGSPAINSGIGTNVPTIDQRGFARDGQIDSGAIEFNALPPTGTPNPTPEPIVGGNTNDTLLGTPGADVLSAGAGADVLIGRLGADVLTGGSGADRFVYSGATRQAALAGSQVNRLDRITDFNVTQGDRLQLDYDNNLATRQRPKGVFNAGQVTGSTLTSAARAAYANKNQQTRGQESLTAHDAVFFTWQKRTYLSVNDNRSGFSNQQDLVVNVTGLRMAGQNASAGVLRVGNYFV